MSMKFKTLAVIASALSLAAIANAQPITSFVNLDFDSGGVSNPFKGFDAPSSPEIIGWRNLNDAASLSDAGVEGPGAWWGTYQNQSTFMGNGNGAYNLSTYTIAAGDLFTVDFFAKSWDNPTLATFTVTLFYDTPANVIGSYTTATLPPGWTEFALTPIAASVASVGGQLGIQFVNSGTANFANLDEVTVAVVPEPASISLMALAGLGMMLKLRRKS